MNEKHIIVDANIHKKAKTQALVRDMSMKEYIEYLLDQDKKQMQKGK